MLEAALKFAEPARCSRPFATMAAAARALLLSLAAATSSTALEAPPCVVALDGYDCYVSTHVDVAVPAHGSRWPLGDEIPLNLEIQLLPEALAGDGRLLVCAVLDGGEPSCAALDDLAPAPLAPPAVGEHSLSTYVALGDGTRVDCHLLEHDTVVFFVDAPPPPFALAVASPADRAHALSLIHI